jgi:AraC-like DNA-binding protein
MEVRMLRDQVNGDHSFREITGLENRSGIGCKDENKGLSSYFYTFNVEQHLSIFILSGNCEAARILMDELFQKSFSDLYLSAQVSRLLLLYGLISTAVKVLKDADAVFDECRNEKLRLLDELILCSDIYDIRELILSLTSIIRDHKTENSKTLSFRLSEDVKRFIDDHYFQCDLSVFSISEQFHLTPTYLSRRFKQQTGESVLKYIHRVRIQKAASLINEKHTNMGSIAAEVGYNDRNTFIRVFKNLLGITPGQYREMRSK